MFVSPISKIYYFPIENMESTIGSRTTNEIKEMRLSLACIATELKRFQVCPKVLDITTKTVDKNKIKIYSNYKPKLKNKQQLISKLRKDLKSACFIAKALATAKKRDVTTITSQLTYARGECVDLLNRYNNNINTISNLHKQNVNLHEKLENFDNFISLGYEELIKIKKEKTHEPTTLAQLKKVIESCGQYYADYCNEIKISSQIKQRNRFLRNKIIILENNIEAIKEQLKALEYRYMRLKTENEQIKSRSLGAKYLNFKVCSEVKIKKGKEDYDTSSEEKRCQDSGDSLKNHKGFDLSSHLEIVKRLLADQDSLLKDLNVITEEMFVT